MRRPDLSLYLVLDPDLCAAFGLVETAAAAVDGGATIVQLRDKPATTAERIAAARALRAALPAHVPVIVNDDVEAALAAGADGLHIGQDDGHARDVRRRIGPDLILGLSVETQALAAAIDPSLVDYAGIGPVFATATKPDHKPPLGLEGLRRAVSACPVPAVAIGGLGARHAAEILAAGAKGMAVVSAICGQPEPRAAASALSLALSKGRRP